MTTVKGPSFSEPFKYNRRMVEIAEGLTVAQRQALLDWPQDGRTERELVEKGLGKWDRPLLSQRDAVRAAWEKTDLGREVCEAMRRDIRGLDYWRGKRG